LITIDLQARFSSQARVDHLQRLKVLLTSLDQGKGFSQKQDFTETLSAAVDLLKAQGVTNAYSQACALLSCFAGQVDIHNMSNEKDPQAWVLHCMKQALHEGVSKRAFHSLFESLEGLGRFDQPWPSEQSQINLLDLLAIAQLSNKPIQILCNQEGPVVPGWVAVDHEMVNLLRTDSGFVHPVFGQFTVDFLITQVCKNALPVDPLHIHVDPVFERCEIGRQGTSGFFSLKRLELIDTRPAKVEFKQRTLSCSPEEIKRLHSTWVDSDALIEPAVDLSHPWLNTDLSLHAQWIAHQGSAEFLIAADMQLQAAANGLKWLASLSHNNVPVSLCIQAQCDIHIHWQHSEKKLPGQLPLGEPLWMAQSRVPLHVQMVGVVGVGKPLIRAANPLVGELVFSLSVMVNPDNHALQAVLTADQSELVCNWQSFDPVKGWTSGTWVLAAPARIMQRELQDG